MSSFCEEAIKVETDFDDDSAEKTSEVDVVPAESATRTKTNKKAKLGTIDSIHEPISEARKRSFLSSAKNDQKRPASTKTKNGPGSESSSSNSNDVTTGPLELEGRWGRGPLLNLEDKHPYVIGSDGKKRYFGGSAAARIPLEEKPYVCRYCGKRYKSRPGLIYHLPKAHNDLGGLRPENHYFLDVTAATTNIPDDQRSTVNPNTFPVFCWDNSLAPQEPQISTLESDFLPREICSELRPVSIDEVMSLALPGSSPEDAQREQDSETSSNRVIIINTNEQNMQDEMDPVVPVVIGRKRQLPRPEVYTTWKNVKLGRKRSSETNEDGLSKSSSIPGLEQFDRLKEQLIKSHDIVCQLFNNPEKFGSAQQDWIYQIAGDYFEQYLEPKD